MKKIFLIIISTICLFFITSCTDSNSNIEDDFSGEVDDIVDSNDDFQYQDLYFEKQYGCYPVVEDAKLYKASYGYVNKLEQGYNQFYYLYKENNKLDLMQQDGERWVYGDSYLENDIMHSSSSVNSVRGFVSPFSSEVIISGNYYDISSNTDSQICILINDEEVYRTTDSMILKPGDTEGYYLEFRCTLKKDDFVSFVLETFNGDATISFNPIIDFSMEEEKSLHYILPEGYANDTYIGDVHPFYDNGKMYMYYLNTSGKFQSCLLTSDNMINYSRSICEAHRSNPPEQDNYFVLGVCKYKDGKYRSYFGLGDGYGCSVSDDLHVWSNADVLDNNFKVMYRTYFDLTNYPAGGRDPYIFYDEDIDRYCIIAMAYKTKEDRYLVLYVSDDSEGKYFSQKPIPLMNFKTGDPECPMAMKIGNRWYIFTSIYGNSSHGVGRLSYWIGDEDKDITEVDWKSKTEHYLEGEDLAAAQLVSVGTKYYLYGWIPSQPVGPCWGGYLNIAREVIQFNNGVLGTRLDPVLNRIISKGKINDINENNFFNNNGFVNKNNSLYSESMAEVSLNMTVKRNIIDCDINLNEIRNNDVSFIFTQDSLNVKVSVYFDGKDTYLKISRENGSREIEYSKIKIIEKSGNDLISLRIVLEGNIIEVFANDTTGLCANTELSESKFSNLSITTTNGVNIENLTISKLSNIDNILD